METNSLDNGQSGNDGTQNNQNEPSKTPTLTTNFLEFGVPKNGEHTLAIIKDQNERRGKVAAKISIDFEGEAKRPIYTARDLEGKVIFPPNPKLWEIKKSIKENSAPLLENARIFRLNQQKVRTQKKEEPTIQKEVKAIGNKLLDEGKEFGKAATDIVFGTGRERELNNIRQRKVQKNKSVELEP
jgi:hypothetical protein